jgi:hypothetical protein
MNPVNISHPATLKFISISSTNLFTTGVFSGHVSCFVANILCKVSLYPILHVLTLI